MVTGHSKTLHLYQKGDAMKVYVLQHEHTLDDHDDVKFIGVYSTQTQAENAIVRLGKQPGFKELPEGFTISEYEVDKDHWVEGYVTYRPPNEPTSQP